MEKIKEYKYVILIALLIIGYAFYWIQIRPELIIKECASIAIDRINAFNEGRSYVPINERADRKVSPAPVTSATSFATVGINSVSPLW